MRTHMNWRFMCFMNVNVCVTLLCVRHAQWGRQVEILIRKHPRLLPYQEFIRLVLRVSDNIETLHLRLVLNQYSLKKSLVFVLESKFYSFTQTFHSVTAQYLMSYVKKKKKSTLLNWCSIWWTHWPLNSQCSFCTVVRCPERCLEDFLSSVPSWHFIRKLTEVG